MLISRNEWLIKKFKFFLMFLDKSRFDKTVNFRFKGHALIPGYPSIRAFADPDRDARWWSTQNFPVNMPLFSAG